jgi:hypothetical protein
MRTLNLALSAAMIAAMPSAPVASYFTVSKNFAGGSGTRGNAKYLGYN